MKIPSYFITFVNHLLVLDTLPISAFWLHIFDQLYFKLIASYQDIQHISTIHLHIGNYFLQNHKLIGNKFQSYFYTLLYNKDNQLCKCIEDWPVLQSEWHEHKSENGRDNVAS